MISILRFIGKNISLFVSSLYYKNFKRDSSLWIFGEWYGERCCDNCLYFANYIARQHRKVKLIWIAKQNTKLISLDPSVEVVVRDSKEALGYLKRAGAVFVVHGRIDLTDREIMYESGALTVNFWHGVPWKKIGEDMYSNKLVQAYHKHWLSLFMPKLYLSTSDKFTDILIRCFWRDNKDIIRAGYPRNSIFYNKYESFKTRRMLFEKLRIVYNSDIRVVTYMPTFRDNKRDVFSFFSIVDNLELKKVLKENNAIVVEKTHFVSAHRKGKEEADETINHIYACPEMSSQELLAASDILITDYSSCFFDFLLLDRPIIHFLYDYEYYMKNDRGLYYKKEDVVGGDVAETLDELIAAINENIKNPVKDKTLHQQRLKMYMQYESSDSCDIIYNKIVSRIKSMTDADNKILS